LIRLRCRVDRESRRRRTPPRGRALPHLPPTLRANAFELDIELPEVGDRRVGETRESAVGAESSQQIRVVCEQHLAHRRRVDRQQGANLECLRAVVGTKDVMHDQHLAVVHSAETDALIGAPGQPVRPVQRPGAQLVAVKVRAAEVQERSAHMVFPRLGLLFDETH
jgi:hypothetical protein